MSECIVSARFHGLSLASFCNVCALLFRYLFFFFNDTATTEIYTLSLHDALPISFECLSALYDDGLRPSVMDFEETFEGDRKSTRLNSSHTVISYAVFCLKKKKNTITCTIQFSKQ